MEISYFDNNEDTSAIRKINGKDNISKKRTKKTKKKQKQVIQK